MTFLEKVQAMENHLTTKERDGKTIVVKVEDAPAWIGEVIREAHSNMMPDDYRYEMISDALEQWSDAEVDDADDAVDAFRPAGLIYTRQLLDWLSSDLTRTEYVDQALSDLGAENIADALMAGYEIEATEVASLLADALDEVEVD